MKNYFVRLAALSILLTGSAFMAAAQDSGIETRLVIRVLAHDAKLIGSSVGGAHIVIKEVSSGRVLADGVQEGDTGNTQKIIVEPYMRHGERFNTEGAAAFVATLFLERPTVIEIAAYAPLGNPEATLRSTKQMLVVPGRHVEGEGIVLELNGFTVDWLTPDPEEPVDSGAELSIRVKVTMLCGCPTQPGGLWDAAFIDVVARVIEEGRVLQETPFSFSGETSIYEGVVRAPNAGRYLIEILAMDDEHGNFGRAVRTITVID